MPVDGKVFSGSEKLTGAIITLYKSGQQIQQVVTTSNGKFSFELPANGEYIIAVTKPGFITKRFKINTANVSPNRAQVGGFNPFEPDVTLFEMPSAPEISKRVEAILSQPIAIYQFIPSEDNFNYDEKYTQVIQDKLAELAQLQKQAEKEMQEKAKNAAVEAQKQLEIDKKYKAAIAKGDGAFSSKDYATAKTGYNEALGIKPNEAYPKQKLAEIDKLLADAGKQKELDAKYQAAITKGDNAFNSKDYATAKAGYTEASGIKPAEAYPKTKLAEIDKLLADATKQKELDAKYQAAITKGDNAFNSKDYATAKAGYTEASGIKPAEAYPKTKLAEIDKLLADANKQKELDAKYQAAIIKGDNAFNSKDYVAAKSGYTEASGIKPAEAYPKTKLAEIDKMLAGAEAEKQKEQQYKDAIAKADAAFGAKDYAGAKSSYIQASGIKPTEQYPKNKIAEIDKILADLANQKSASEKEQQYKDAIAKGDKFFAMRDYANSKSAYNEALGVKPSEQYPKNKIAEIDKILADLANQKSASEKEQQYKDAIAKGDKFFAMRDYPNSKSAYNEALGVKPSEQYPKDKISEIDKILSAASAQKEIEAKYQAAITKGDNAFNSKEYTTAKSGYTEASGIKPAEAYPKTKLAEIDKLLAANASNAANLNAQKEIDAKYQAAIAKGDNAFNTQDYPTAKAGYKEASIIKPLQQYPKDKLAEIEKIEKNNTSAQLQAEKENKYNDAIVRGDRLFTQKEYGKAKPAFQEALTHKPIEKYPKEKIKQIDEILKKSQITQTIKKEPKQVVQAIPEEEKQKLYQSELRTKYPNGVTEEEFTDNGKTILRRVVIKNDFAGVYTKVTHNWGGIYCFRDNVPITEIVFENETR